MALSAMLLAGGGAAAEEAAATAAARAAPAGEEPATEQPGAPSVPGSTGESGAPASPLNPAPEEFPGKPSPQQAGSELDSLLSRVAALRSRIAALTSSLFSSRLKVDVRSRGDAVALKALSVTLDGAVVYTAPKQAYFDQPEVVYEHAVAPGPHVLGIEVERYDKKNQKFSTWQASRFVVVVVEKQLLWTRFEIEDDSSMAEDFPEDGEGQYQLEITLSAEVAD